MLVSCSCDGFIRPGKLRVVLANKIIVRFQTQKTKPNPPKIGRYGHFGPILGPVFWKLIFLGGAGGIEIGQTQP